MTHYVLVYSRPEQGEQRYELQPGRAYRIGSRPDNDVVLGHKDVSRHHAILEVSELGKVFHVTDLNSKNGTFVNGQRVAASELRCGDQLNVSSAAMVILEVTSGSYRLDQLGLRESPESGSNLPLETEPEREDTMHYRSDASMEDMVDLLEQTANATRSGDLSDLLDFAVARLSFEGAMVLYRDDDRAVAMAASAGDLGRLLGAEVTLGQLVREHASSQGSHTVRQLAAEGEQALLASLRRNYVLLVRFTEDPPAVADMRALMAAVDAVLGRARLHQFETPSPSAGLEPVGSVPVPALHELPSLPLAQARERVERWLVARVLVDCGGNRTEAAKRLGLSRAGLFKKLRRLDVDVRFDTPG